MVSLVRRTYLEVRGRVHDPIVKYFTMNSALNIYMGGAVSAGHLSYVAEVAEPPTYTKNHEYSCKCATRTDKCAESSGAGHGMCLDEWGSPYDGAGHGSENCEG